MGRSLVWQRLRRAVLAFRDVVLGRCDDAVAAVAAAEASLRSTRAHLIDALESSDDAFSLFDADDRLTLYNTRYRELYPTIRELMVPGARFEDLLRASAERGQYMGIAGERLEPWVQERLAHHRTASGVFEQKLADGRCLEIVERATAGGGRVAIRRDVTARKRIEEALRQELAFKQTLMDALPFPVFFKGLDGSYLGCNAKFAEALGQRQEAIVGRTLAGLLPPEQVDEINRSDAELLAQPGVQNYETTMCWADGSIRRVSVAKGTFNGADGKLAGIIGSFIDLTQQKRTEEQLVQAAKLATLGQIASEVAHELNQPLSIIRMSAESCLQSRGPVEPDALERRLATIVGQVRRMAEIVDHLRSFSRIEAGEMRPFAPAPVVAAATRLLSPHFQLDGIALTAELDEDCPEICGRPNQLEQVILNLLANARDAVRAIPRPGQGRVEVSLRAEDGRALLSIKDNGGGVPEAMWPMVFDPFFTTKAEGAGTGLGLSISAGIISGMGGRIDGRNVDGGACFTISLPLHCRTEASRPPSPALCEPAPPPGPATGGLVLLVDDEELAVECIAEFLEGRGFRVIATNRPEQALAAAAGQPVDLLISDIRMPGLGGTALLERLRGQQPDLPAVLMTGGPLPGEAPAGTRVVRKPLALDELARTAERLLAERWQPCAE